MEDIQTHLPINLFHRRNAFIEILFSQNSFYLILGINSFFCINCFNMRYSIFIKILLIIIYNPLIFSQYNKYDQNNNLSWKEIILKYLKISSNTKIISARLMATFVTDTSAPSRAHRSRQMRDKWKFTSRARRAGWYQSSNCFRIWKITRDSRQCLQRKYLRPAFAESDRWHRTCRRYVYSEPGYRLVYPCQGHSDVHLHGNTARRRRHVTGRVSIRLPDKRLLDPDDLTLSFPSLSLSLYLVAYLHVTLWLLGRPVETKFCRVLRDLKTQPSERTSSGRIPQCVVSS